MIKLIKLTYEHKVFESSIIVGPNATKESLCIPLHKELSNGIKIVAKGRATQQISL